MMFCPRCHDVERFERLRKDALMPPMSYVMRKSAMPQNERLLSDYDARYASVTRALRCRPSARVMPMMLQRAMFMFAALRVAMPPAAKDDADVARCAMRARAMPRLSLMAAARRRAPMRDARAPMPVAAR